MRVACCPCKLACVLFVSLSILAGHAQGPTGAVSSTVARPAATAAASPPESKDSKPLPWKFLASPMGVLNDTTYGPVIKSLGDCSDPQHAVPSGQVQKLLSDTVGDSVARRKAQYVVIHVVDPTSGAKGSDGWYLYRLANAKWGDPKWDCEKFTGQRIYGAPAVLFLFVHLHTQTVSLAEARKTLKQLLADAQASKDTEALTTSLQQVPSNLLGEKLDKVKATEKLSGEQLDHALDIALKTNALDTGVKATDPGFKTLTFCDKASGEHFQWFGNDAVPSTYAKVRYESAVVRRTPANIANLKTILGLLFGAQGKDASCLDIPTSDGILWGAGQIDNIGLPSDVSIAGYAVDADHKPTDDERTEKQIGAVGFYNDEQLYWWDASIGIPVHKIKDLQYSDSNNTVVASQVDKQSVYAMFNLMVRPADLSDPKSNLWPRLLVGFPLASSPWDKLFAGGGIGIPLKPFKDFQFFAGATFIRSKQPATLGAGSGATDAQLQNDLRLKTTPKFTFGINVPVKSVIEKLR
jgi:hypothetical protein